MACCSPLLQSGSCSTATACGSCRHDRMAPRHAAVTVPLSIVSPDDQKVTFVELFFDLVFVYCVTQVASLLHGHFDLASAGSALLVFWLVWWAWTQFTWALNAANTEHHRA